MEADLLYESKKVGSVEFVKSFAKITSYKTILISELI